MDASGADDGTDFRPFFDMVIDILFVLLILVAAQIYFQQIQNATAVDEAAKREAALRRADIAAFLDVLAGRLRADGLDARADHESRSILLPFNDVLSIDAAGLPAVDAEQTDQFGAALGRMLRCVTVPRSAAPGCSDFTRLGLDALAVRVRAGALPLRTTLPRDRFGDLGSALVAARTMAADPALVAASNARGERVITFDTAAAMPGAAGAGLGGDLDLDFTFE